MIEKILKDELMNEEELENVAGGTNGEYKELRKLLPVIKYITYSPVFEESIEHETSRYMYTDEVEGWLKQNLNIDANIDNGAWYNPLNSAGNSNIYSRNGQSLTHAQVVNEVKNFIKNN